MNKTNSADDLKIKNFNEIDFETALISELKLNPCLLYDDDGNNNEIWTKISLKLNRSVEECQAIWDNLKINFFEYYSNNDSSWKHYQSMMFSEQFIEKQIDSAFEKERIADNDDLFQNQSYDDCDISGNDSDSTALKPETIFIEESKIENVILKKQKKMYTLKNESHLNYENKVDAIIEEVKNYPCIYDTKVLNRETILERKNAFKQIAINTGINSEVECRRLWKNLRGTLCKVYRNNNTDYRYYDKMKFFFPYLNISLDVDNKTFELAGTQSSDKNIKLEERLEHIENQLALCESEIIDCLPSNSDENYENLYNEKISESLAHSLIKEVKKHECIYDLNFDDLIIQKACFDNIVKNIPDLGSSTKCKQLWDDLCIEFFEAFNNKQTDYVHYKNMLFLIHYNRKMLMKKKKMNVKHNVNGKIGEIQSNKNVTFCPIERNNVVEDNLFKLNQTEDKNYIPEETTDESVNEDDVLVCYQSDSKKKLSASETQRGSKGPRCDYESRIIKLIEEVRKYPSIYNRNLSEIPLRRKSFEKIAQEFPEIGSVKECMALWKNVRGTFVRMYKNNQTAYVHYDRLKFLIPFVNRPSNYVISEPIDGDFLNEIMLSKMCKSEIPMPEEQISLHLENYAVKKENFEGENCKRLDESTTFNAYDQHTKHLASINSDLQLNINNLNVQTKSFTCNNIEENDKNLKMSQLPEDQIKKCGELMFLMQWDKLIFSCLFCEEVYDDHHEFFEHVKSLHFYSLSHEEYPVVKNEVKDEDNENYNDCRNKNEDENGYLNLIEKNIFVDTIKSPTRKKMKNSAKCDKCDLNFPDFASLQRHKIYEQRKFECKQCGKCVLTQFALDQHSKTHIEENKKNKKCNTCGAQFSNIGSLYRHKIIEQQKFKCKYCSKCKLSKFALDLHENTHASQKKVRPVKCNVCNKLFPDSYSLYRHRIYEKEKYKCQYCGKCVLSITALNRHVSTHTGEKNFHCDQCELKFRDKQHLKNHIDKYHLNIQKVKAIKWVKCRYCDKACKSVADRSSHELRHTGEKPYVCFVCGKKFARNTGYRVHMAIHENKQNIKCEIPDCIKTFNTRGAMKSHLTSHLAPTELNYSCPICNKKMKSRSSLGRPKAEHAAEKPFDCSVCPKAFAWKSLLDNHMRNHPQFRQLISN